MNVFKLLTGCALAVVLCVSLFTVVLAEAYEVPITIGGKTYSLIVTVESGEVITVKAPAGVEVGEPLLAANAEGAPVANAPTANRDANLRGGPGTTYPVVGAVTTGQPLDIVGRNADGSWYQLRSGAWLAAFLATSSPAGLPVTSGTGMQAAPAAVQPTATPAVQPTATPTLQPAPAANCDPSYPTVCIPPSPPDLDCPEISHRRFQVVGADPHGFDRDNDGIGCESN